MRLSIIVPALNEAPLLPLLLHDLQPLRGEDTELIVVDGGSTDQTRVLAAPLADKVLCSASGRARQLNAGARSARGALLLFLHADSRVPPATRELIAALPADAPRWGFFRVQLRGRSVLLPLVSTCMWWRSRIGGIATGDQGLLVPASLFRAVGGYPEQPLMEDLEICHRLGRRVPAQPFAASIDSSGRRWDEHGALRTIALMWWLRLRYYLGASPHHLAQIYLGR